MTGPSRAAVARAAIRRWGFREFCRQAWPIVEPGTPCLWNWHHDAVCDALDAVAKKQIRNLIVNIPPGCTKTTLVTKLWPAYLWALDPGERVISASYDKDLMVQAAGLTRGTLRVLLSPWFRSLYPRTVVDGGAKAAERLYDTTALGFRFSTSVMGQVTGRHATVKIVDDPQKPMDATDAGLAKVWDWYRGTWSSRNAAADTRQVVIMQRIAEGDLVGRLIEEEGDAWTVLRIPMEYREGADPLPYGKDPRTQRGELLWPARYPAEEVRLLRRSLGVQAASAQLDQDPTPPGGLVFDPSWFPRWGARDLPPVMDRIVLSCDATFKGGLTSDRVAWTVWGQRGCRVFLLGAEARQRSFLETLDDGRRLASRWHPHVILVEDKANGEALMETWRKSLPGVIPMETGSDSKVARAQAVTGYCAAGDVLVPEDRLAPWAGEWLRELAKFPRGRWDDYVDSTSQALRYLLRGAGTAQALAQESAMVAALYGY